MAFTIPELRGIARKYGLENPDLFATWFHKSFPKEGHEPYVGEWAERFKRGNPTAFMDNRVFKCYLDVLGDQRGIGIKKVKKVV